MARTWLQMKIELLRGCGHDCDPPPRRLFIVGPSHTFEQLAHAINAGFARWDLSHLHQFELADGRVIGTTSHAGHRRRAAFAGGQLRCSRSRVLGRPDLDEVRAATASAGVIDALS